jgi:cyanophycinase
MSSRNTTTVLIGGGWGDASVYEPFLTAAGAGASVACLVLDEGDGAEYFAKYEAHLADVAPARLVPVFVQEGGAFDPAALADADALLVCGGLTPAYADALAPAAGAIREWLAAGRPYAGMSAGAAVAAARAVVGGYLWHGRVVCPPDTAEDLDDVTVVDGLGVVPFAVDVHAAQWGTLGRLVTAVGAGLVEWGLAIDEDTALVLDGADTAAVIGRGAVHVVRPGAGGVGVLDVPAGGSVPLG